MSPVATPGRRYPGQTPTPPNPVPRDDPNDYTKVPHAPSNADFAPGDDLHIFEAWERPGAPQQWVAASLLAFTVTHLARTYGTVVLHPIFLAVAFLHLVVIAWWTYATTADGRAALAYVPHGLVAVTVVVLAVQAPAGLVSRMLLAALATGVLAMFLDAFGSHALEWRMRRLGVPAEFRERWMGWWSQRFEAAALRTAPADAEGAPLAALEARLRIELAAYQRRLLLLAGLVPVAVLDSAVALATLPIVGLALVVRGPDAPPARGLFFVLAKAAQGWIRYAADGDHVLGRWRSPAGSAVSRRLVMGAAVLFAAIAFLPMRSYGLLLKALYLQTLHALSLLTLSSMGIDPLLSKTVGQNPLTLWQLTVSLAIDPLLPLVVLGSAALVVLGRILWAVENLCPHPSTEWTP